MVNHNSFEGSFYPSDAVQFRDAISKAIDVASGPISFKVTNEGNHVEWEIQSTEMNSHHFGGSTNHDGDEDLTWETIVKDEFD
jgi:hypothetical protein